VKKLPNIMKHTIKISATIVIANFLQSCVSIPEKGSSGSFFGSTSSGGGGGKRVALVIGNNRYTQISPLDNPVNDATDISNELRQLGFEVILKTDVNKQALESMVKDFGQKIKDANVALLYFSGHGLQVNGENILVPTDYKGANSDGVSAHAIQKTMSDSTKGTKIMILDACRNDPAKDAAIENASAKGLKKKRSIGGTGRGLAPMPPLKEFIVMYATAAGQTASDGTGTKNSPYTAALLKHINEPIPIETLFKRVAKTVEQITTPPQLPANYTAGLTGDFCFTGCGVEITNSSNTCQLQIGKGNYEGECQDNKANGQGVQRYADGEYYTGSFQNNLRHGYGKQYLTDGTEISGRWDNGRLVGK